MSVSPQIRARMQGPTYLPRLEPGELIPAPALAEVIAGPPDGPSPGTVVGGLTGWQEYAVLPVSQIWPIPEVSRNVALLGRNGLTAYAGIREVASVRAGETVVVSSAAGAVGHVAGQLARIAGARVVGITGSDQKNEILLRKLGYSAAVNRRSPTFAEDLEAACPSGVDVYFDVAGSVALLDAVLAVMVEFGRIICCGLTARTDAAQPPPGSAALPLALIRKSLRVQGFGITQYLPLLDESQRVLNDLEKSGRLTALADIRSGLDAAPAALIAMLAGGNIGQVAVRVGPGLEG